MALFSQLLAVLFRRLSMVNQNPFFNANELSPHVYVIHSLKWFRSIQLLFMIIPMILPMILVFLRIFFSTPWN